MPRVDAVAADAATALDAYGEILRAHPWAAATRARLQRAPQAIAARVESLLAWQPSHGPEPLLAALDDAALAWLCRDATAAGTRRMAALHPHLAAHDLTLAEARRVITDWLDPEGALHEESVLAFE